MGYRSEVAIAMKKDDWNKLINKARNTSDLNQVNRDELIRLLSESPVSSENIADEYTVLHWDSIKWYDEGIDPVITWIMDNLPTIYKFIRIGEDNNDIEVSLNDVDETNETNYEIDDIIDLRRIIVW